MSKLICRKCNAAYPTDEPRWRCDCGHVLDIKFTPAFPLEKIEKRGPFMWRYREAIPIEKDTNIISFAEGFTPLLEFTIAGKRVLIKQEQLFSTGSYKDRGASVLISKVKELGIRKVIEDSSGNAGSAVAAYCAAAGIACDIFVPGSTSKAKLTQIKRYGAALHKIPGTREDTAKEIRKIADIFYYASHYWSPFFFHGTKTFAFEVCEQLGWMAPDTVILPVGHGSLLLGAYIGFDELRGAGIIGKIPRLIGVQAENCAPLYKTFNENLKRIPKIIGQKTIAEGIAIAVPVRGNQVLAAVKQTGGYFIAVSENEIKESLLEIWGKGHYIEPTSAAAIAGIKKYLDDRERQEELNDGEIIVSAFTGHGLKGHAAPP